MQNLATFHKVLLEAISTTSSYDEWILFLKNNDLTKIDIERYERVPQGLRWHPEFELSKHVYLISVALHRQGIDELLEAAFFHDWGKIEGTNVGKDRIYSYGHAELSVPHIDFYREYLEYWDITRRVTEKHMEYDSITEAKIKDDVYLKAFVNADKNMSSTLFYELFPDQQEINKEKELKLYKDQSTASLKIYIAVGISGSGKSTYIRENFDSKWIVSSDAIREEICGDISCQKRNAEVWKEVKTRLVDKMAKYGIAVLDATNIDKGRRIKFMSTFNGCRKIALVFPVDLNEAISRVNGDVKNNVNRSNVPTPVIKKQYDTMRRGLKSLGHEFNEVLVMSNESNEAESIKVLEEIKSGEQK